MPNKNRDKGSNAERELVNLFKDAGFTAWRVPYSGAMANYKGDLRVKHGTEELEGEVKVRDGKWKDLYEWIGNHDFLAIKRTIKGANKHSPKSPFLILCKVDKFMELITREKEKKENI